MMNEFRQVIGQFPDKRTGQNTIYCMEDIALGAFSVFFTQSASFLAHQTAMTEAKGKSNAQTLFGLQAIPSDNHIRKMLDVVPPQRVFPMFENVFNALNESGHLQDFRAVDGQLLIALDGTQYHSSNNIHCAECSVKEHRNGQTSYSHTVVTPVIVSPGRKQVLPLEPEFITPQDGHKKQDCETAAAKRWINQYGARYKALDTTLLGDDLYSRQPLCEQVIAAGLNFIFVCKPQSHTTLYDYLDGLDKTQAVETLVVERRKGKKRATDTYRFVNQLPIRDHDDALQVNWCELITTGSDGRVMYRNAFVSNHLIGTDNVVAIAEAGRARWKVENENNNTLKTKGYHLSHNFGHGKQHLSTLLASLNLLAFLFHTVLDMMDNKYQLIRSRLSSRKMFFQHIQALTCYHCFDSFDALLDFMIVGLEIDIPDTG
ncbi:MAG: ISNCY family transposase [Gammaproteobacteria bacterium]|nr:ISNCY family transposase [Gammaproteobacteria bacterium]